MLTGILKGHCLQVLQFGGRSLEDLNERGLVVTYLMKLLDLVETKGREKRTCSHLKDKIDFLVRVKI